MTLPESRGFAWWSTDFKENSILTRKPMKKKVLCDK